MDGSKKSISPLKSTKYVSKKFIQSHPLNINTSDPTIIKLLTDGCPSDS